MKIEKTENNVLLVPKVIVGENGLVGDAIVEIKPEDEDYDILLKEYHREQSLELNLRRGKEV